MDFRASYEDRGRYYVQDMRFNWHEFESAAAANQMFPGAFR